MPCVLSSLLWLMIPFFILGEVLKGHKKAGHMLNLIHCWIKFLDFLKCFICESGFLLPLMMRKSLYNLHVGIFLLGTVSENIKYKKKIQFLVKCLGSNIKKIFKNIKRKSYEKDMLDNLHVGMSLAGEGSLWEDGCTFIQRHRYTSIFMTTTHRYMKVLQFLYWSF